MAINGVHVPASSPSGPGVGGKPANGPVRGHLGQQEGAGPTCGTSRPALCLICPHRLRCLRPMGDTEAQRPPMGPTASGEWHLCPLAGHSGCSLPQGCRARGALVPPVGEPLAGGRPKVASSVRRTRRACRERLSHCPCLSPGGGGRDGTRPLLALTPLGPV